MIREENQSENVGVSWIVYVVFLAFPESKKKLSKKQQYFKTALVNNNKESIIESRIIILIWSWFQLYKFMKSQIINYKKQSYFFCITCIIECHIFAPRKENRYLT